MNDRQPLISHLRELRDRLIKSVIALSITSGITFFFTDEVIRILKRPAGDIQFIFIEPTEMFSTYFKVALLSGVVLAIPFLVFQLVMFIRPALLPGEKKYLFIALPGVTICFLGGVLFGYFVLLPPALHFLLNFGSEIAEPAIRVGNYISFVVTLLFWLGVIFETPFVLFVLARLGIVTPKGLAQRRRWMFVGAFVIAAIITPTPDPLNQVFVAVPIILLYELGTQLSKLAYRQRVRANRRASEGT